MCVCVGGGGGGENRVIKKNENVEKRDRKSWPYFFALSEPETQLLFGQ